MTKKEQILILLKNNPDMAFSEIAEIVGSTRQYVDQIKTRTLTNRQKKEKVFKHILSDAEAREREKISIIVRKKIMLGEIVPQPCEVCGVVHGGESYSVDSDGVYKKTRIMVDAHHDDYTKPLDLRWLCRKHHREWHSKNTPIHATDTPYCTQAGTTRFGRDYHGMIESDEYVLSKGGLVKQSAEEMFS